MELRQRVGGIELQLQSQEEKMDILIDLLSTMTSASRFQPPISGDVRPVYDPYVAASQSLFQHVPHPAFRRRPTPGPHVEIENPTTTHSKS